MIDGMMWGIGGVGILGIAVLLFVAAAAIKYPFFNTGATSKPTATERRPDGALSKHTQSYRCEEQV